MRYYEIISEVVLVGSRHVIYWHGTNNTSGSKILQNGFLPGFQRQRLPKGYIPPAHSGIYLTPRVTVAIEYAYRENRQKFSWLFGINATKLVQVEIDEDEIGTAMRAALYKQELPTLFNTKRDPISKIMDTDFLLRSEFLSLTSHLPAELLKNLRDFHLNNAKWLSDTGKILNDYLSTEAKLKLIDAGCNIAHGAAMTPDQAWRFDTKLGVVIYNDCIRNGVSALPKHAEQII